MRSFIDEDIESRRKKRERKMIKATRLQIKIL